LLSQGCKDAKNTFQKDFGINRLLSVFASVILSGRTLTNLDVPALSCV